jgi:hypothetical protein
LKLALRIVVAVACVAAAGCWPWHQSETPQQRFIEALSRGQSAQASQIWLKMSAQDKVKFAQSQGMESGANPDEVNKLVVKHYEDQAQGTEGAQDTGGETVEGLGAPIGGASLQNLPGLTNPPQATSAPGN